MNELVSVIVAACDQAAYPSTCLGALLFQGYLLLAIVAGNDGARDDAVAMSGYDQGRDVDGHASENWTRPLKEFKAPVRKVWFWLSAGLSAGEDES